MKIGPSREGITIIAGQAGVALMGILSVKILTQLLEPDAYGGIVLANTIIVFFNLFLYGPVGQGVLRFWSVEGQRGRLSAYFRSVELLAAATTALFLLALPLVFMAAVVFHGSGWPIILLLSIGTGVVFGLASIVLNVFDASRDRLTPAVSNWANAALKPVLAVVSMAILGLSVASALAGYFLASLLTLLFIVVPYTRFKDRHIAALQDPPENRDRLMVREMLIFIYPFVIWGLFGWMHLSCDRWILQAFSGPAVVGEFGVMSQVAVFPIAFLASVLLNFYTPIVYDRIEPRGPHLSIKNALAPIRRMVVIFSSSCAAYVLLLVLFHRQIILIVSDERYLSLSVMAPIMATIWAIFYLGHLLTIFGKAINRPNIYILPKVVTGVMAVAAVTLLTGLYGVKGTVAGTGMANLTFTLWCAVAAKKISDNS